MNYMMLVEQRTTSLTAKEDAEDTEEILLRLATIYLEQERYEDILDLQSEEPENLLMDDCSFLSRNGRFGYCL